MQTCIRPSLCHCHSLSLASVKSRLVLPFWYRLTRVLPDKGQLNGCVSGYVSTSDSDSHSDAAGIFFRHDEQRSDCVRPRSAGDQHAVQPVRLRVDDRRPGVATWDLLSDVISTCSGCWHPPPHRRVKHRRPPTSQGLLSHSGRTSVSDWRTFPVLCSTCS